MEKKEPISLSFHPITNQKEFDQNFKRLREKARILKKALINLTTFLIMN